MAFLKKCTSLKNEFFNKKCIIRAFFIIIIIFLNNIKDVKECSKLSEIV